MKRFMSNPTIQVICIILVLIVLDQGIKIIVNNTIPAKEELFSVSNTIHIHPYLNDKDAKELSPIAQEKNIDVRILVIFYSFFKDIAFFFFAFILCGWFWLLFWDFNIPKNPFLVRTGLGFLLGGVICGGYIDELFWGGSLDYICISFYKKVLVTDHYHIVPKHIIFDAKDIFLLIGFGVLVAYVAQILAWAFKTSKDKEISRKIDYRLIHPIKTIKTILAARKKQNNKSIIIGEKD